MKFSIYLNRHVFVMFQLHLICKVQEDVIKTEEVVPMTRSKTGPFSNQVDITLKQLIQSGQFFNLSKTLSMSTLSASFRMIRLKLNELC